MSGLEKAIKTPKIVENCSNYISKGSQSMYARQPDIFFYIVIKVIKQDLKMTKIQVKFVPKSLT